MPRRRKVIPGSSVFRRSIQTAWHLLGLLWQFDKPSLIGNLSATLIPAAIPFVNAYIYALIIDLIVKAVGGAPFNFEQFYILIGVRVISLFVQDAAFSLQEYFTTRLNTKFPLHLYQLVLNKLSELDVQHFENSEFRDQLEKVRSSYVWTPTQMLSNIFFGLQSTLQFLIALVAIATLNWILLVIILIAAIPTVLYENYFSKALFGIWSSHAPERKKIYYISDLLEGHLNVKEIKLFRLSKYFLRDLRRTHQRFVSENLAVAKRQLRASLLTKFVSVALFLGIEIYIFYSAIVQRISIGDITYYTTVMSRFQDGVDGMIRNFSKIFENSLYVQEMFEILKIEPVIVPVKPIIKARFRKPPRIEFRNVWFRYPETRRWVLKDFTLTIEPGQKIALVGENGAGKTTLVKLLARFYDPERGQVLIDGMDLKHYDLASWHEHLGILFQDFLRYEYPLRDNIRFGRVNEPQSIAKILSAAREGGADQVATKLPDKYDQMLGRTFEGGIDLSTGQWQKVALARAFLRDAQVLVLDEPTAAIDAKAERQIFNRIQRLSRKRTVFIISHRFSTVRRADRIFIIEKGRIKESGSHASLMKQRGTYATLFNLQAEGYR